jgi:hypothetical protein
MTGNGDPEFWAKARAHLVRGLRPAAAGLASPANASSSA